MIVVAVLYGQCQLAESVDLATFLATWHERSFVRGKLVACYVLLVD
jgi:hypothetical protein